MQVLDEHIFLSTPSARRATEGQRTQNAVGLISIHALREEGDAFVIFVITPFGIFLSTPSARRATRLARRKESDEELISIHALREEGDTSRTSKRPRNPYFYPRPPRGGRPLKRRCLRSDMHFYPRPPRGGRLGGLMQVLDEHIFLSTPSARRATAGGPVYGAYYDNFYPRPPRGGRPCPVPSSLSMTMISIHALREEGDARSVQSIAVYIISIHALREEGDFYVP